MPGRETPAPVRDLLVRTESRDWVPGEHAPILEWTGVAYAWLVAIPGTALLFALAWIVQRPTRFGCAWLALWVLVNAVHLILAWQHGGVWTFLWPWQVLPRPWQALP